MKFTNDGVRRNTSLQIGIFEREDIRNNDVGFKATLCREGHSETAVMALLRVDAAVAAER